MPSYYPSYQPKHPDKFASMIKVFETATSRDQLTGGLF